MKNLRLAEQKGIAQFFIIAVMLVLAVALPVATKLVQQNQETRSKATDNCSTYTGEVYMHSSDSSYCTSHSGCEWKSGSCVVKTCKTCGTVASGTTRCVSPSSGSDYVEVCSCDSGTWTNKTNCGSGLVCDSGKTRCVTSNVGASCSFPGGTLASGKSQCYSNNLFSCKDKVLTAKACTCSSGSSSCNAISYTVWKKGTTCNTTTGNWNCTSSSSTTAANGTTTFTNEETCITVTNKNDTTCNITTKVWQKGSTCNKDTGSWSCTETTGTANGTTLFATQSECQTYAGCDSTCWCDKYCTMDSSCKRSGTTGSSTSPGTGWVHCYNTVCADQEALPPTCGDDNKQTLTTAPTKLCKIGSASSVTSATTSWTWACGKTGFTSAQCSATKAVTKVWQKGSTCNKDTGSWSCTETTGTANGTTLFATQSECQTYAGCDSTCWCDKYCTMDSSCKRSGTTGSSTSPGTGWVHCYNTVCADQEAKIPTCSSSNCGKCSGLTACKDAGCAYYANGTCGSFGNDNGCTGAATKGECITTSATAGTSCKKTDGTAGTIKSDLCLSSGSFYGKKCCAPNPITPPTCQALPGCEKVTNFETQYRPKGDFNCDGKTDVMDFGYWKYLQDGPKYCVTLTAQDFSIWKTIYTK